jgi:ubiquinol-cytochrome c reductase cytochrome c1 subunit
VSCCRPWRWPPAAGNLQQAGTDLNDKASLQRGAQLYMNYCSGCHSLKYVRYARIGEDLGLSEDDVQANLNFNGGKIGDHVISPMTAEMGVVRSARRRRT